MPCRLLQQVVVLVQLLSDLGVNLETKMNTSSVTEFHGVCVSEMMSAETGSEVTLTLLLLWVSASVCIS